MIVLSALLLIIFGCSKEDGFEKDVSDKEGNVYKTVRLGEQVWMGENLRSLKYHNETDIPDVKVYDDDEENVSLYGRLYTWEAATDGAPDKNGHIQGPCPRGWHIPTDEEWKELETYLGLPADELNNIAWRGTIEGGMLKESGTETWASPNSEATNTSLFAARGGGHFNTGLGYSGLNLQGLFWTASEAETTSAWNRVLRSSGGEIGRYEGNKEHYLSVRCIKN